MMSQEEISVSEPKQGPDFVPLLVLLGLVLVIGAGVWLFPYLHSVIQREDCIATGRNDCN